MLDSTLIFYVAAVGLMLIGIAGIVLSAHLLFSASSFWRPVPTCCCCWQRIVRVLRRRLWSRVNFRPPWPTRYPRRWC